MSPVGLNDVPSAAVVSEQRCTAGYHVACSGATASVLSGAVKRDWSSCPQARQDLEATHRLLREKVPPHEILQSEG
ncbi:unnamed protein product [Pleuronectes platessa]|uniref:Uncharacterized protein n=1 Tax=Pleuronectes platessa TaxID=8262 RepID=A0A9N7V9Z8_PLEPL|nr:unnamed protein product [Pleuronectes platessa]